MSKQLREFQSRKASLVKEARALTDRVASDNRDMTDDEVGAFDALRARIDAASASIDREAALIVDEARIGIASAVGPVVTDNREGDAKRGFYSLGEFMQAVYQADKPGQSLDARLLPGGIGAAAPSTYSNEAAGQDGGFLVPPQFSQEIFKLSLGEDSLLPLTDNIELGSANTMAFPKDESTPWGNDGVRAYWQNEATAGAPTKLNLSGARLQLHKLFALVPASDEMLQDSTTLGSYLPGKMAQSIRWKSAEAFMFGTGNGQPAGAFNSAAVVTVVKESGQATNTLDPKNLAKMVSRLPPGSYGRAVWMINNDVLPALFTLVLGNYPIYIAPSGEAFKAAPYGTLLGRPIIVTQHAKSFSSQGDVLLVDWKGYRTITKAGGIQMATSMHLYFDADATAFRASFRVDGQSKLSAPINPANGSATMSTFVQLGAR